MLNKLISFVVVLTLLGCDSHGPEQKGYTYAELLTQHAPLKEDIQSALTHVAGPTLANLRFLNLQGGMTSTKLYTFVADGKKYVLRIMKTKHGHEPIQNEIAAHQIAARLGLAPELVYADPQSFIMIMPFIEGHPLSAEDLKQDDILASLGQMLAKLHHYSGTFSYKRTQVDRVKKHHDRAIEKGVALPSVYETLYQDYLEKGNKIERQDQVLCHADLNSNNILVTSDHHVYIIDWTGATWDNRYTDLSYLTFNNGFTEAQSTTLLQAYFDHTPTGQELNGLDLAQRRTCFLAASLWFDFSESMDEKSTPLSVRVKMLDELLNDPQLKLAQDYIKERSLVSPTSGKYQEIKRTALGFLKTYMNWKPVE